MSFHSSIATSSSFEPGLSGVEKGTFDNQRKRTAYQEDPGNVSFELSLMFTANGCRRLQRRDRQLADVHAWSIGIGCLSFDKGDVICFAAEDQPVGFINHWNVKTQLVEFSVVNKTIAIIQQRYVVRCVRIGFCERHVTHNRICCDVVEIGVKCSEVVLSPCKHGNGLVDV